VMVYSRIKQKVEDLGAAVVHIFRFHKGKIVEMWDVGQPVPKDSPNENGML
jgi:predicted SnoaL-like aldol condensation-catalyzing enzyme